MTTITCDICDAKIDRDPIRVTLHDGEHPHNGSTCYRTVDCCWSCATKIPDLKSTAEYDDIRRKVKKL